LVFTKGRFPVWAEVSWSAAKYQSHESLSIFDRYEPLKEDLNTDVDVSMGEESAIE
jgi:hypothetical protein